MKIARLCASLLILIACSHQQVDQSAAAQKGRFKKVILIVLENTDAAEALHQPFLAELVQRGALLTDMNGEAHPSQPNYVAMIAGDTMGVTGDDNVDLPGKSLADLMQEKGRTWKNYAEGYPGKCYLLPTTGRFVRRHVPFLSFQNVTTNPKKCANIVDGKQFDIDLKNHSLPDFSFYTPDLDNDGHDTTPHYADRFMERRFGTLLRDENFTRDHLFIVTFDESESYAHNHIYTVLVGGKVIPKSTAPTYLNHISILRMMENEWDLGSLHRKDETASTPEGIWR